MLFWEPLDRNESLKPFEKCLPEGIAEESQNISALSASSCSDDKDDVFSLNLLFWFMGLIYQSLQLKNIYLHNNTL